MVHGVAKSRTRLSDFTFHFPFWATILSAGKESACIVRDLGLIPGLGRSLGERKGYPLQNSGPENSMDYTVHGSQRVRHDQETFTFTVNFGCEDTDVLLCQTVLVPN